jgi:hypothetical protein
MPNRETGLGDGMIEDQKTAAKHRARYDWVWQEAADEADTIHFIERQTTNWSTPTPAAQE